MPHNNVHQVSEQDSGHGMNAGTAPYFFRSKTTFAFFCSLDEIRTS